MLLEAGAGRGAASSAARGLSYLSGCVARFADATPCLEGKVSWVAGGRPAGTYARLPERPDHTGHTHQNFFGLLWSGASSPPNMIHGPGIGIGIGPPLPLSGVCA